MMKMIPSTMTIINNEFQRPNPSIGEFPGNNGRSGMCTIKSGIQWLSTFFQYSAVIKLAIKDLGIVL
jgi:hypothetical protein